MTLLERSQKISNPNLTKGQIEQCEIYQLDFYDKKKSGLAELHKQVQNVLPVDKLAQYLATNPSKARAEVKGAAQYCFNNNKWDNYSNRAKLKLLDQLMDLIFGFGPIETLLDDSDITEIMVNSTDSIYYEKSGKLYKYKHKFKNQEQVRALIDRILGPLGRRIDESSPMVNARLEKGHRVHAIIPPLAIDGPTLTIRKFSEHVITLDEMIKLGSIDKNLKEFLKWAVLLRKNIAVSGGTGSGKTTLLNALSCEISHNERVLTIEDSAELRFLEHPHVVRLEARPKNSEGTGEVTIKDLVANALRMRPDRIVVGECRGGEALDMLQAMNTGHDGSLTTLHANSPFESISRLTTMVRYAAELPVDVIESYIASAIDLVVQTSRGIYGNRYVSEICSFVYERESKKINVVRHYYRGPFDKFGKWFDIPVWIDDVCSYKLASKEMIKIWKLSTQS